MSRRAKKPSPSVEVVPLDPAADVRKAVNHLHAIARKWQWRGRGGDARTQAAARVLTALSWALLDGDEEGLAEQGEHAARYLEAVRERYDVHLDPFARSASGAYERILQGVERQVTGKVDDDARKRAAQWFVVLARVVGFPVPALPDDDEAAVAVLVRALGKWRSTAARNRADRRFDDAREQAESWTRCMAAAAGRRDAPNVAKHRMRDAKKPAK